MAIASALGLASCGGGDESVALNVVAVDPAFDASHWSVPAGEEVTVTVSNEGANPHDWTVVKAGYHFDKEQEVVFAVLDGVDFIDAQIVVVAGKSVTETLVFDEPGTYQVICTIADHLDFGMEGTITVES